MRAVVSSEARRRLQGYQNESRYLRSGTLDLAKSLAGWVVTSSFVDGLDTATRIRVILIFYFLFSRDVLPFVRFPFHLLRATTLARTTYIYTLL